MVIFNLKGDLLKISFSYLLNIYVKYINSSIKNQVKDLSRIKKIFLNSFFNSNLISEGLEFSLTSGIFINKFIGIRIFTNSQV